MNRPSKQDLKIGMTVTFVIPFHGNDLKKTGKILSIGSTHFTILTDVNAVFIREVTDRDWEVIDE